MREAWYVPYSPTRLHAERVLVLAPHSDDEVFGCGGTLAMLAAAGAEIEVVIVSRDESGHDRLGESHAAASLLGYLAPAQWHYADRGLEAALPELTQQVGDTLERLRPTLVFAPSPWEIHPDHRAVCDAAMQAAQRYADTHRQQHEEAELRLALYEIGLPLTVTDFIDITPHWQAKREAMACFASQLQSQRYDAQISGLNIYRSYTLGLDVQAAEALHILNAFTPASWPPLPSQQDMALVRCEAALAAARTNASAPEAEHANAMLDTIYATRGWRWLTRLKRWLGRGA
ncbi:PIG-L deacetylase family protein [Vreelandella jeotgali]|uniref:PIG-L deacetylase family protein n=1 Tax=Vreelandella jeotgali TaxID=553386 RepID=UPI0003497C60|nr:PIG-L deacetylase family protein [Halomonas jeotgali]